MSTNNRWRIVQCECLDCTDPSMRQFYMESDNFSSAARQEPPPKCVILHLDGAINDEIFSETWIPHLNGIAAAGSSCLLALRNNIENDVYNIYKQLFGMVDYEGNLCENLPSIQLGERFKGMKARISSSDEKISQICKQVGCEILEQTIYQQQGDQSFIAPEKVSTFILQQLDISNSATQENAVKTDEIDLLFLNIHIQDKEAAILKLEWLDEIVRLLNKEKKFTNEVIVILLFSNTGTRQEKSQLNDKVASQDAHISIINNLALLKGEKEILIPGQPIEVSSKRQHQGAKKSHAKNSQEEESIYKVDKPLQSFQFLGMDRVDIDDRQYILCVKKLPGVIRCDECSKIGFQECVNNGGEGCILIDRLLYEIAYKLARAPKYGA
eukprot:TRINITY_DN12655_c1_g1_i1.p1 TRINITY_DN12655_c1_g1~~TRINITY_DN12655_c1_g1_i1.p1  ORF type:complete len:383 (+),score=41.86 TRINITY_DN12655_c1_g1_i1:290-1438(+)